MCRLNELKHGTKLICIKDFFISGIQYFRVNKVYKIYKTKEYSKTDEMDEIYVTFDGHKESNICLVRFFIENDLDQNIYNYFIPVKQLRKNKLYEIKSRR